jgi:hypothetical protein
MRGGIPICFPQVLLIILVYMHDFRKFLTDASNINAFEVWKLWVTRTTWICKEQDLGN